MIEKIEKSSNDELIVNNNERRVTNYIFTFDLVFFWLKAKYQLTNKMLTGEKPNTVFFKIIPLGKKKLAQPLKTVASVSSSTKFHIKRLLAGCILIFMGTSLFDNQSLLVVAGIILTFFGLVSILNCYTATFCVTNNAGKSDEHELSILEKSKVEVFVNEINAVVAEL